MKRRNSILLVTALLALLAVAGIVYAQEKLAETDKETDVHPRMMARGMGRMQGAPGTINKEQAPGMRRGRMGQPQAKGRGRMAGGMGMLTRLADKLDLSEEQQAEIKDIHALHKKNVIRRNADLQIARVELQELMQQEEPDLNAIEDQVRNVANLGAGIKYSQIKVGIDTKNVLTEEQQAKLKELRKDRRTGPANQNMRQGGGPGPRRGQSMRRQG